MILFKVVPWLVFNVRGWMCRNSFFVVDSWRGVAEEAIRVFVVGGGCGQEEPGIIMRVRLATGSTVVEKTDNCPHESKIKAFLANRDRIGLKIAQKKI